ncbi:hypothetical protein EXVG_00123 [Emiliania huxleyi virus 202]|nr:hypothetical protein EXVG_00123 [Emiliania huxleyi virus 202]AHA54416.1 putative protease [Emiliania huxleyi virus 18]AHA55456.1 putative protease [Emiliania huxleyi virus 156]
MIHDKCYIPKSRQGVIHLTNKTPRSQFPKLNDMSIRTSARLAGIAKPNYREVSNIPTPRTMSYLVGSIDFNALQYQMAPMSDQSPLDLMTHPMRKRITKYHMLTNALASHGLEKKKSPGDGNCLYHSLTDQINSLGLYDEYDHVSMRRSIVAHIYHNYDFYGNFIEDKLVTKLRLGKWGSHVDVSAAADLFNVQITVVKYNGEDVILPRHNNNDSVVGSIFLCFQSELHYDSTKRIEY